jgi:hypothetical protein
MTENRSQVSFDHAQLIASCCVLEHAYYSGLKLVEPTKILDDIFMESNFGWIFWGSRENFVPSWKGFSCMVNKKGECQQVANFITEWLDQNWREKTISKKRKHIKITFCHAKKIAEISVLSDICRSNLQIIAPTKLLEDNYLETEYCWIFLRNKKIVVPSQNWFSKSYGAYAVSKKGHVI